MVHQPPPNPWYRPPTTAGMATTGRQEQPTYTPAPSVYATAPAPLQYSTPVARAPTYAHHEGLERAYMQAPPLPAPSHMSYSMPMARAPTMAECDEIERRRALGLPQVHWLAPARISTPATSATIFGVRPAPLLTPIACAPPVRPATQHERPGAVLPLPPSVAPSVPAVQQAPPIEGTQPAATTKQKRKRKKKQKPLSKNQQKKLDKARWAAEKAERAKAREGKPPPPPTAAEIRRREEKERLARRPWSPYVEPPSPFPPPGICTYEPQIGSERKRKPMPSRWTTMCGTYAAGPYIGRYGQEYWEEGGGFNRCITDTDGTHKYEYDIGDAPEDSFIAAALQRGELHLNDFRGAYLDHEGRTYPFPPPRSASRNWQKYLEDSRQEYELDEPVPTYRPPSPTARPIPYRTREILPDKNFTMDKLAGRGELWDPESEVQREFYAEEHIGDHGLWVRSEHWVDEDWRNDEPPLLFIACDKIPAGSFMAAAMDDGDFPESDSEDEAYGLEAH
ncbi:unnamed protein product [Peniophora sp. CBMAI 1063]|nr:unnamed protein product [Peniophora sp. CBMAI 1063]